MKNGHLVLTGDHRHAAGADTNGPLVVAVIGGMVSPALLTLVVPTAVYSLVENGIARLRDIKKVDKNSTSGNRLMESGGGR